ncbi:hypothetical protein Bpfe_025082, partial [Biomphalaria pfeifferi]
PHQVSECVCVAFISSKDQYNAAPAEVIVVEFSRRSGIHALKDLENKTKDPESPVCYIPIPC